MKILLTGGLGFVGKRFVRKFGKSHEIIVFSQEKSSNDILQDSSFKNIIFETGRIEEQAFIDVISRHKPDVVIHLAALTGLKKCQDNPEMAFRVNVYGAYNVAIGCANNNSKLVFISSREVYGETNSTESSEEDELSPNNIYGLTKMIGENIIKYLSGLLHLNYTILRITNVYGPEGDGYGAQIMIQNAIKERTIRIFGGSQRLNFIFVDDVAELLEITIKDKRTDQQIFNVGSDYTMTINDFVEKISKLFNEPIELKYMPMRETETANFKPNLRKLEDVLNFRPRTELEDGLKKTIEWYKSQ